MWLFSFSISIIYLSFLLSFISSSILLLLFHSSFKSFHFHTFILFPFNHSHLPSPTFPPLFISINRCCNNYLSLRGDDGIEQVSEFLGIVEFDFSTSVQELFYVPECQIGSLRSLTSVYRLSSQQVYPSCAPLICLKR